MPGAWSLRRGLRPAAFLGAGLLAGAIYALADLNLDRRLEARTLTDSLAIVHTVSAVALPLFTGALLGLVTFSWRERALLAKRERHRAESLQTRLAHVERDQAVWVMAASVLHEVRNPLHVLGLLLDDLDGTIGDGDPRVASLVERSRIQMGRIATHLDTLRALPATSPRPVALEVRALLERTVEERTASLQALAIHPEITGPGRMLVRGDPTYVRVIVENLLDNSVEALRASDGDRTLEIRLTQGPERAEICVADQGPGVPEERREILFAPFRSTKERGLGLGLPIARALARSMDGELSFEGTLGGETRFCLRLPVAEEA